MLAGSSLTDKQHHFRDSGHRLMGSWLMGLFGKRDQIEPCLPGTNYSFYLMCVSNYFAYCYQSVNGISLGLAKSEVKELS
jgi:hypothetical protein